MTPQRYGFHSRLVLRTPIRPLPQNITKTDLLQLLGDQQFLEAIYLSSPALYQEARRWKEGHEPDLKREKKLIASLTKYYFRMSARCTPFGLFSGCSLTRWQEEPTRLIAGSKPLRHSRLDMQYLGALARQLENDETLRNEWIYYPNRSIYSVNGQYRYIETNRLETGRTYRVIRLNHSALLRHILVFCEGGATLPALRNSLEPFGLTDQEMEGLELELVEGQVLLSELEPSVCGEEYPQHLLSVLKAKKGNPVLEALIQILEKTHEALGICDEQHGNPAEAYRAMAECLKATGTKPDENRLVQTDSSVEFTGGVSASVQASLLKAIQFMSRIHAPRSSARLRQFAGLFAERYGEKPMPLMEVLHDGSGMGYTDEAGLTGCPLTNGLYLQKEAGAGAALPMPGLAAAHGRISEALAGSGEWVISEADLAEAHARPLPLPPSLSVMFRLLEDEKIYLESAAGPSAASLLGRFSFSTPGMHELLKEISAAEQARHPELIFAEINFLPEDRIGNIMMRPRLREYHISLTGKLPGDAEKEIALNDLYVMVKQGQVYLFSRRLGRFIIPRLSSAYNYMHSRMPVFRFLCDMQGHGLQDGLAFNWHELQWEYKRLPRVRYENVILAPAQWNLESADWEELNNANTDEERMIACQNLRRRFQIPERFVLSDGDNELPVISHNAVSILAFADAIKNRSRIILKEWLLYSKTAVCDAQGVTYANQFAAVLMSEGPVYQGFPEGMPAMLPAAERFAPGSEWLYYKCYCHPGCADEVITDMLAPMVAQLESAKLISKWFFIRYEDPGFHLRIRLHIPCTDYLPELMEIVNEWLSGATANGCIWKTQVETYERENLRYGAGNMECTEELFWADSQTMTRFLQAAPPEYLEEGRWLWGARLADNMLDAFGYDTEAKSELMDKMAAAFNQEFAVDKTMERELNSRFAEHRRELEQSLETDDEPELAQILTDRYLTLLQLAAPIRRQMEASGQWNDLMASYIHMTMNRLFRHNWRLVELALYRSLSRYYKSLRFKQKQRA